MKKLDSAIDYLYSATSQALVFDEHAWSERHKHIQMTSSVFRRVALQAIHHATRACPDQLLHCLVHKYEQEGLEVLGIGRGSTVIRMGESAVKIMRRTANSSESERLKTVDLLKFRQEILLKHMGEYAVEQTFGVIDHPIRPKRVVVAWQPVVEGFSPVEPNNLGAITDLNDQQRLQVNCFSVDALEMAENTGWVTDVLGASNFGFADDGRSLVLVDTIPLCTDGANKTAKMYLNRMAVASEVAN